MQIQNLLRPLMKGTMGRAIRVPSRSDAGPGCHLLEPGRPVSIMSRIPGTTNRYLCCQTQPFGPMRSTTRLNSCFKSSTGAPIVARSKSIHLTSPFLRSITFRGVVDVIPAKTSPWHIRRSCIFRRAFRALDAISGVVLAGTSISPSRYSSIMARCSPESLRCRGILLSLEYIAVSEVVLAHMKGTAVHPESRSLL